MLRPSAYFLIRLWTRHSRSAGGFFDPPPKYTSYSIFRRLTPSSRLFSSSSTVGTERTCWDFVEYRPAATFPSEKCDFGTTAHIPRAILGVPSEAVTVIMTCI